tara:strand:+ start:607 stop:927 length:321 start_codon:yes stop_codon:yes gene_type:complete
MIPFIRSLPELMAITKSRDSQSGYSGNNDSYSSTVDSGQRKRYIRSLKDKEVDLPYLPKTIRRRWSNNKESISKFLDKFDYNNHIPSSYDLTLIARQNKINHKDVA